MKDPKVQAEARKKRLEKTGYEFGQQKPECRKHMSEVMKSRSLEAKLHSSKLRQETCKKKYGVKCISQLDSCKRAVSESWASKSEDEKDQIVQKRKATKRCRYGNENYVNAQKIRQTKSKFSATKKAKIKAKRKRTCLRIYNAEHATQSKEIAQKISETLNTVDRKKKYQNVLLCNDFVEPLFSLEYFIQHATEPLKWRCKLCGDEFVQQLHQHQTRDAKVARCLKCFPLYENKTAAEDDIASFIKTFCDSEVVQRARDVISPRELDVWIPEKKVAVEYNGIYWHSLNMGTSPDYHISKTAKCEQKGIHLLQIFENEWNDSRDQMKSLLRHAIEDLVAESTQLSFSNQSFKECIGISFDGGSACLKKRFWKDQLMWHLEDIHLAEDSKCSFHSAIEQLASYCLDALSLDGVVMKLDRRFFQKKEEIGKFKLVEATKPQVNCYVMKNKGTKFYPESQKQILLETDAKGDPKKIFYMVDCGQLVYIAKGAATRDTAP